MNFTFDDLDDPSNAPQKRRRKFVPKEPKHKPVAEADREPEAPVPSSESNPAAVGDSKPPPPAAVATVYSETDIGQPSHTDDNVSVKMDSEDTYQQHDEEDEIVREIDFVNSDFKSKLHVCQYPLRPSWRSYNLGKRCETVLLRRNAIR